MVAQEVIGKPGTTCEFLVRRFIVGRYAFLHLCEDSRSFGPVEAATEQHAQPLEGAQVELRVGAHILEVSHENPAERRDSRYQVVKIAKVVLVDADGRAIDKPVTLVSVDVGMVGAQGEVRRAAEDREGAVQPHLARPAIRLVVDEDGIEGGIPLGTEAIEGAVNLGLDAVALRFRRRVASQ